PTKTSSPLGSPIARYGEGVAEFRCPVCGGSEHRRWSPMHPALLHWRLNPALAINELVFGQCVPREIFVCTRCDAPQIRRTYARCASCGTFHSTWVWARANAFGHWLGLVCP